jgi:hypothetical protein
MVAGPGVLGTGVASAHLFGIDIDVLDIFDHKEKKKKSDHSAKVGNQRTGASKKSGGSLGGPNASAGPKAKVGASQASAPSAARSAATAEAPQSTGAGTTGGQAPSAAVTGGTGQAASSAVVTGGTAQAPSAVVTGGGGGGGGVPTNANIGRAPNLAPVPTAPSSRAIVIRSAPPKAPAIPAAPVVPVAPAPVAIPPVPALPAPVPSAPPAAAPPAGPSAPIVPAPRSEPPAAQQLSVPAVPESFRLGYADYLRTASTSDLLLAVLPGLGGMVLMTAAGGVVGFRQARAAQTLPSPQIARFLP